MLPKSTYSRRYMQPTESPVAVTAAACQQQFRSLGCQDCMILKPSGTRTAARTDCCSSNARASSLHALRAAERVKAKDSEAQCPERAGQLGQCLDLAGISSIQDDEYIRLDARR